jgi:hypothetical protein
MAEFGLSQRRFCRVFGLNRRDLSLLMNYRANRQAGKRLPSRRFLHEVGELVVSGRARRVLAGRATGEGSE